MFHETYRKTHVSDSVFQQSSRLKVWYFIKKDIWHKCVPVNFSKILRTAFLQNTSKYSIFNNEKSVIKVRIVIRITGIRDTCNSIIITSFYQRRIRTQRDSHWRDVQWKKLFLKILQTSQEEHRLWHMCFPVNFAKFLRTTFLYNTTGRVKHLLDFWIQSNVYDHAFLQKHI